MSSLSSRAHSLVFSACNFHSSTRVPHALSMCTHALGREGAGDKCKLVLVVSESMPCNALDDATGIMHYLVAHGQRLHQEVEATIGRAKAGAEMACV
eukprot:scaffold38125_cov19-Tisochrysis_lutea.AAC.1